MNKKILYYKEFFRFFKRKNFILMGLCNIWKDGINKGRIDIVERKIRKGVMY